MATIDLGKIRLLWRGDYDATVLYEPQDMVRFDRDLHICTVQPPVGTDPTDTAYWSLMVERNGFFWQGDYNNGAYKRNDAVLYGRSSYFCTVDSPAGTLPTDTAYWTLLAEGTSITTAPGDLIFRDVDNVEKPFPISANIGDYIVVGPNGVPEYQTIPMTKFGLVSHLMNSSGNVNPTSSYMTFIMQSGDVRGVGRGTTANYLGAGDLLANSFTAATPGFDIPPKADGTPVKALKIESTFIGSIALMDNGEVWAWGWGTQGQIGDDGFVHRQYPRKVAGLTGITIVDIASCGAGAITYCSFAALDDQGRVWMWGSNAYGQLGIGNAANQGRAYQINASYFGNQAITQVIGAGGDHGFFHAVAVDGSVYAWGRNAYGQLGNGDTVNQNAPVSITIATSVKYVRSTSSGAGYGTTYFLCDNGDVYAAGYNLYGQVGDGSVVDKLTAIKITSLSGVRDIYCGGGQYAFVYAVKTDGTVYSWGHNAQGQLGAGNATNQSTPGLRTVTGAVGVTQIVCGGDSLYGRTYLLDTEGKAFACGYNAQGQLGLGDIVARNIFEMVHLPAGCQGIVKQIGCYGGGTTGNGVWLLTDGRLFACGDGTTYYANGLSTGADVYIPQPIHM